jgi:hypothetical protein
MNAVEWFISVLRDQDMTKEPSSARRKNHWWIARERICPYRKLDLGKKG